MAWIIGAVFVVVFAGVAVQQIRRRRGVRTQRELQESEPLISSSAVLVKRESAPRWALGARGFRLNVRASSFAVIGIASQSWYFRSSETTIGRQRSKSLLGWREWITVSGFDGEEGVTIWMRPSNGSAVDDIWDPLIRSGARTQ